MYDERFCRMWEFYLISAEMMFRTGSQLVFHMQLARKRDAAPIVRDYITDLQRRYREMEAGCPSAWGRTAAATAARRPARPRDRFYPRFASTTCVVFAVETCSVHR